MFTLKEIAAATKAVGTPRSDRIKVQGVAINSKTVRKGDLFVAVKGHRFDGHAFVKEAIRRGAVAVMISRRVSGIRKDVPVFRVDDTIKALGHLARYHRDRFDVPVIAVTGSAGKTTTKDLIAEVLRARGKVLKNTGSQNNFLGVPLTLFRMNASHKAVIVELGTNRFGDIPWLTYVARPNVAVLSNIGESHLELLRSPRHVFREKSALVKGMEKGGVVIFNNDDRFLATLPARFKGRRYLSVGITGPADYRASGIGLQDNRGLKFLVNRRQGMFIQTPVAENIYNALIAICCGRLFNVRYNNINRNIRKHRFEGQRQVVKKIRGYWVLDDTYNANPVSLRSALRTLVSLTIPGRRILVLGDMLELGARSAVLHERMGRVAAEAGVDAVLTYGRLTRRLTQAVNQYRPQIPGWHFRDRTRLHQRLVRICRRGDAILVKGSRAMRMEQTIEYLQGHLR